VSYTQHQHQHQKHLVLDVVDDTLVTDPESVPVISTLEFLRTSGPRRSSQPVDARSQSRLDDALERAKGAGRRGCELDTIAHRPALPQSKILLELLPRNRSPLPSSSSVNAPMSKPVERNASTRSSVRPSLDQDHGHDAVVVRKTGVARKRRGHYIRWTR